MDDDKFGACGLVWVVSMFLLVSTFREWGFPVGLMVVLSLIVSLTISMLIYVKWTK
jgi:hypothetical protein